MSVPTDFVIPSYAEVVSDREGCRKFNVCASVIEVISGNETSVVKFFSLVPFVKGTTPFFWNVMGDMFFGWNKDPFIVQVTDFKVYADVFDGSNPSSEGVLAESALITYASGVYSTDIDYSSALPFDSLDEVSVVDSFAILADFTLDRKVKDVSFVPVVVGSRQALGFVMTYQRLSSTALNNPVGVKLYVSYNFYVPKDWDMNLA